MKITQASKRIISEGITLSAAILSKFLYRNSVPPQFRGHSFPENSKIAILVPHPDDEIVGCFHFLQKAGTEYTIDLIYITDEADASLASERREESRAATRSLSINEKHWWHLPDGGLHSERDVLRRRLNGIVSKYDFIFCPAINDRTSDHIPIAEEAYAVIPAGRLIWYRSTWWTFSISSADFIFSGKSSDKRRALSCFQTQRALSLNNPVYLSGIEARYFGLQMESVELFQFATSNSLSKTPFNALSIKSAFRIKRWECASSK